jgi:hypothetical protein
MRVLPCLTGITVLLTGCVFGRMDPSEASSVQSPYGRTVDLVLTTAPDGMRSVFGELLWVERDAVVVLARDTVFRVPLDRVLRHRVVRGDSSTARISGRPDPELHFTGAARYPGPLDPDRVDALLDALGLEAIRTLDDPLDAGGPTHSGDPGIRAAANPPELAAFLDEARAAADRLARLETAIAEGYRRLGPSFPGMGEHWVHPGRVVEGRIDPRRPAVVCYVRVDDQPRLTSLAFTLPLDPDEKPPASPFGREAWHDHAHTVDEESLLLAHPASVHDAVGPRLSMVHVWIWPENPDGVLAQNNWRLPFAVAGLPVDALDPSVDAARAVSLWTAEAGYYEELFRAAANPTPDERAALLALLVEHRRLAGGWLARRADTGRPGSPPLSDAAAIWSSLWDRIEADVSPGTWRQLAPLR